MASGGNTYASTSTRTSSTSFHIKRLGRNCEGADICRKEGMNKKQQRNDYLMILEKGTHGAMMRCSPQLLYNDIRCQFNFNFAINADGDPDGTCR